MMDYVFIHCFIGFAEDVNYWLDWALLHFISFANLLVVTELNRFSDLLRAYIYVIYIYSIYV